MVNGMLELTGQKEDVDGYYREKFENAKKAWEAWKNYLEEKDARRKAGRERAMRRKAMGYDEHNDNWKGPSWVEGREGGREGGGRGWDRQGTGVEDKWVPRAERGGRGDEEEEEGEDKELENHFLDRLMFDLDKTPGAGRRGGREGGREGEKERGRGIGRESTLGDDELDALIQSSPVSTPPEVAQRRGGVEQEGRVGGRGRGGGAGGGAGGGTLSEEEQKELDVWLGMISSGRGTSASSSPSALSLFKGPASLPSSSFTPSPGMGGQPRPKPPSGAKGKDFSLDPEEEKELNEWLNRFDADYKEGADGLRVEKTKSGREEGTERGREGGREKAEGEDAVDRELADLLTKLEAAEISASAGGGERGVKIKGGGGTAPRIPSLGVEGVEAAVGVDSFLSELYRPSKGGKRGKKGAQIEASSGLDSASLLRMALEDVGGRGGEAEIPPISSRSQDARMNTGHRGGEEEEEDERKNDETLPASVKRRLFVSRTVEGEDEGENEGEDEGGDDEEEWGGGRRSSDRGQTRENDLLLGAYSEDPEEAPGQFLEEGLEESVHLGRPRGGGMGGMRQGYMYDDPLGGGRELMSLNARPGGKGGSRDGRKGEKGDWMRALAEENVNSGNEDIFNSFEDVGDLEELEKLDTLFAGEVGQKGEMEGKIRKNRVKRNEDEWGSLLDEVDLGELDEFEEIEKLVNTGRKRQEDIYAEGKSEKRNSKVLAPTVGGRGRESTRLSPSMIEGMKVVDLRAELRAMGLTVSGSKADLQARLVRATQ
ncbi:DNA-binding SAP [Nannochloropsis gaditana]|uniref:DNA-binding SAP n=1 Tax=Nannochloropsis gaditana TaxID=72520 RepID=W7TZ24_9STRA|nr:DNA-binding SAP [Nannochloropsis gaditana]